MKRINTPTLKKFRKLKRRYRVYCDGELVTEKTFRRFIEPNDYRVKFWTIERRRKKSR